MKKTLSLLLALLFAVSCCTFVAQADNEPTTEALEAMIKLVKPKLDVPEGCTEFTWRYNAKSAYNDESWHFTWRDTETRANVSVSCDAEGHITYYHYNDGNYRYGALPSYGKAELEATAKAFLARLLPEAAPQLVLHESVGSFGYSGCFTYNYIRTIGGYPFYDNRVSVSVDFETGVVLDLSADFDYALEIKKPDAVISPEKAAEILGTRQKMILQYRTKVDYDEATDTRTVKAYLVYSPETYYLAVDACTGEIYDAKSSWRVEAGSSANAKTMRADAGAGMYAEETAEAEYVLTEEEKAGVAELEGLISKDEAIRRITENEYLYFNTSLTSVSANLNRNRQSLRSYYQNDNGSYTWNLYFSNPVLDEGKYYYGPSYAYATVNAETGALISYSIALYDATYYEKNDIPLPEVRYSEDAAKGIGEAFLKAEAADKFALTRLSDSYPYNIIRFANDEKGIGELYGAYSYSYIRVNEGIDFPYNHLNVAVDGVTGKVASFNYNWYTNVEFESPKGAMSPEKALDCLLSYDGYGINYERNVTYLYHPLTTESKKDVLAAFVASLTTTYENGGDVDKIIEKYASKIDREKLLALLADGDSEVYAFAAEYFGVDPNEAKEDVYTYIDSGAFYDKIAEARLVYSLYDMSYRNVSPFSGKQLDYNGDEYVPAEEYVYSDMAGHWAQKLVERLADVGIGFAGGKFLPDAVITAKEFSELAQKMYIGAAAAGGDEKLDRISAVRQLLTSLGYAKVAELKGIYKTSFADNDTIKEEDIGYTAIAYALGILKGDGTNARVYDKLTRAEAVTILTEAVLLMRS